MTTMTGTDSAASPAPADVVRRQYLASAAGDLEALRATLAPDVEYRLARGTHHGPFG
jgi:ketosteroid isomerase-like protein